MWANWTWIPYIIQSALQLVHVSFCQVWLNIQSEIQISCHLQFPTNQGQLHVLWCTLPGGWCSCQIGLQLTVCEKTELLNLNFQPYQELIAMTYESSVMSLDGFCAVAHKDSSKCCSILSKHLKRSTNFSLGSVKLKFILRLASYHLEKSYEAIVSTDRVTKHTTSRVY